jgi:hypothetical protein
MLSPIGRFAVGGMFLFQSQCGEKTQEIRRREAVPYEAVARDVLFFVL